MMQLDDPRLAILSHMDIPLWQPRVVSEAPSDASSSEASVALAGPNVDGFSWDQLATTVNGCQQCVLHTRCKSIVFGSGAQQAQMMLVGDAPGADDDYAGQPFMGRAGQMLAEMLHAIGLQRHEVFLTNAVKCRPPNNRQPAADEAVTCGVYLAQQITLLQPKVIIAVGDVALERLTSAGQSVAEARGQKLQYSKANIPVIATHSPGLLLREPLAKRQTWDDLCLAVTLLQASEP